MTVSLTSLLLGLSGIAGGLKLHNVPLIVIGAWLVLLGLFCLPALTIAGKGETYDPGDPGDLYKMRERLGE